MHTSYVVTDWQSGGTQTFDFAHFCCFCCLRAQKDTLPRGKWGLVNLLGGVWTSSSSQIHNMDFPEFKVTVTCAGIGYSAICLKCSHLRCLQRCSQGSSCQGFVMSHFVGQVFLRQKNKRVTVCYSGWCKMVGGCWGQQVVHMQELVFSEISCRCNYA